MPEPMTSLNPVLTIGEQIAESLRRHEAVTRKQALERTIEMLKLVQIPNAAGRVHHYPHQFSGGMRQRVLIAAAFALEPRLVIADEPTTALDVTVQAQIMDLLREIQKERDMGLILITHDLGVVAEVADRIAVMYAGRIVEQADVFSLFRSPGHPYTEALLQSLPRLDLKGQQLTAIKGLPPSLASIPSGCPFHPRCPYAVPGRCDVGGHPALRTFEGGQEGERQAACVRVEEIHPGVREIGGRTQTAT